MAEATRGTVALASLRSREELGDAYGSLRARIDGIVQQAEGQGSLAIAIAGLNSVRQTLDSLSRLAGHDRPPAAHVTVDLSVNVNTAVRTILTAIGPTPAVEQIIQLERLVDG
jgi:hypothetical protein